mmetsp:Transcript_2470/g.9826  ORF Transcript_2470/g.9826 Transcript_2470/m.9826 type:complete len:342 (+) Transcript_2470:1591-2616(+)
MHVAHASLLRPISGRVHDLRHVQAVHHAVVAHLRPASGCGRARTCVQDRGAAVALLAGVNLRLAREAIAAQCARDDLPNRGGCVHASCGSRLDVGSPLFGGECALTEHGHVAQHLPTQRFRLGGCERIGSPGVERSRACGGCGAQVVAQAHAQGIARRERCASEHSAPAAVALAALNPELLIAHNPRLGNSVEKADRGSEYLKDAHVGVGFITAIGCHGKLAIGTRPGGGRAKHTNSGCVYDGQDDLGFCHGYAHRAVKELGGLERILPRLGAALAHRERRRRGERALRAHVGGGGAISDVERTERCRYVGAGGSVDTCEVVEGLLEPLDARPVVVHLAVR